MKIREINFGQDTYATFAGQHVKRLISTDKLDMELHLETASVRVNDRNTNGEGVYHVPLACLRRWFPAPEERTVKR